MSARGVVGVCGHMRAEQRVREFWAIIDISIPYFIYLCFGLNILDNFDFKPSTPTKVFILMDKIPNGMRSITKLCVICLRNNTGPFRMKTSIYYLPTLNHKKLDRIPVFDPK